MVLNFTCPDEPDGDAMPDLPPPAFENWPAYAVEQRRIDGLLPYTRNARTHSAEQIGQIAGSMREWGWTMPVLIDEHGVLIAGHGRILAAQRLGFVYAPSIVARGWTDAQTRAYRIADNQIAARSGWDRAMLGTELEELREAGFELDALGFEQAEIDAILRGEGGNAAGEPGKRVGSLAERFLVPPFTVLNARDGWWQGRKRGWLALGLQSELGRGENLLRFSETVQIGARPKAIAFRDQDELNAIRDGGIPAGLAFGEFGKDFTGATSGTSIFDPVLCEIAYRWFCPPAGLVLDPFAGGSVRGIVAAKLGRRYLGIDLHAEQCAANEAQRGILGEADPAPEWRCGDARDLEALCGDIEADFVFSCPPYADLERYSDDPRDLSTMDYPDFLAAYRAIIAAACARLRPDRFACFVVGDVRDPAGAYRGFVADTIAAFRDAGLALYNEAILVTALGSLPIRAGKQFETTRKLGKTHQNVLVFLKGDVRRAVAAIGPCEFGEAEPDEVDPALASAPPVETVPA